MNRTVQIALGLVVAVVVAVACFFGGVLYGKGQGQTTTQTTRTGPAGYGAQGQGGAPGAGQGGRGAGQGAGGQGGMLAGTIQSVDNGVMTIVDSAGKMVQIRVTDTTLIQKQASVNVTDLQKGETVLVSGTQGTDGSYTARSVQVAGAGDGARFPGAPADATPGAGFRGNARSATPTPVK